MFKNHTLKASPLSVEVSVKIFYGTQKLFACDNFSDPMGLCLPKDIAFAPLAKTSNIQ